MTVEEMDRLVRGHLPVLDELGARVTSLGDGSAVLTADIGATFLRPGGVVCGPALFALADAALWAAILTRRPDQLLSVTISLNIGFLRPVPPGQVRAEATLLRFGRRVAFGDIRLFAPDGTLSAHATGSYALADGTGGIRPPGPPSSSASS